MNKKNHYPLIDSLRAIACIFVIFVHSSTREFLKDKFHISLFEGGYIGVDLFFVLSGFLITSILINQYLVQNGNISVFKFYQKRILRLYPPLILATLIFLVPLLQWNKIAALSNTFFLLTYTSDCVMIFRKLFPALQYPSMFSQCWSLAIEEQFYLIFPPIFITSMKYFDRKENSIIATFPLFNIIFIATLIVPSVLMKDHFYKFFLWRFFEIFFGGYISFIYSKKYQTVFGRSRRSDAITKAIKALFEHNLVAIAAFVLYFAWFIFDLPPDYWLGLHFYILTIICAIIIVNAYKGDNKLYRLLLSNKTLIYLGKISYGLYLYHFPIFYLREIGIIPTAATLGGTIFIDILSVTAALILSIISFEYCEKYFLKLKARIKEG